MRSTFAACPARQRRECETAEQGARRERREDQTGKRGGDHPCSLLRASIAAPRMFRHLHERV